MRQAQLIHIEIGDISIAVTHWPGAGDPVLLLHATGFHSRCWDQVVQRLPQRDIYAPDLRFHGRSGNAGDVDWQLMCEDISAVIAELDLCNITGVGHSIGGYIMSRIAAKAPQRFRQLLLIDPVILPPDRYQSFAAHDGEIDPSTHHVGKRKNHWTGPDEMFERFQSRAPFNTWQSEVLRDYCDHALGPANADGSFSLACDPLQEAAIYLHSASNDAIYDELPGLKLPVTLLRVAPGAENSQDLATSPTWPELAQQLPDCREVYLPHMNHFIPMQDPALVAKYIEAAS